jgi:drug/metabolite transporter (DMT)-like permease
MNWGVQQWGPSKTGSFVYFQPLFGTLGAVFLLNEQLTLVKILAGILIIAGVWINSMQLKN